MTKKITINILLLFLFKSLVGQVKDTLYLLNNSIIIGEMKKIKMGRVEFDGDGIGIINVKYDKIKSIQAACHLYRVETTDRKLLYGTIRTSDKDGFITINTPGISPAIHLSNISSLIFFGNNFETRLSGNIGAGYSYTKSSDIGRLNLNASIKYTTRTTETALTGNMIITADSISTYRERENLQGSSIYYINNNWLLVGLLSYQRNLELGLQSRWQTGAAIGYKFLQLKSSQGKVNTGIVINSEKNFSNVSNTLFEWATQVNYNFFSFSKPNLSLSAAQMVFVSLSQKGRIRYDGDIDLSWEVIKDFSITLNFYHNYDRKSPATGLARVDYGYVAGISYKF
jgi:hypothetical protein